MTDKIMNRRNFWNFCSAGRVVFGMGVSRQLLRFLKPFRPGRVFVVTDQILVRVGMVDQVLTPLRDAGIQVIVFDGGEAEPSFAAADRAVAAARSADPDLIIGLGGGSNMDLAKITAAAFTHGGNSIDYSGFDKVPGPVIPLICIPTTSGTGSEVSHAAVLTDLTNLVKVSVHSHYLRPAVAVVDPELTFSCPKKVTADSGIDALVHAIEGYTAVPFNELNVDVDEPFPFDGKQPMADCLAEKSIRLIGEHLERAVQDPQDRSAREGMSMAAMLAGLTFSNSAVAAVHALEYPLGAGLHCSHGAGNGLLLPWVMRFNLPAVTPEYARIAELLGEDTSGCSLEEAAAKAIAAVERICRAIDIPERIRDLGATRDQLPQFAARAFAIRRLMLLNGRQATEADLLSILESAY
ncbi:MAG: iron-containing alcohol dehydrogenase [Planctomyces sp.]